MLAHGLSGGGLQINHCGGCFNQERKLELGVASVPRRGERILLLKQSNTVGTVRVWDDPRRHTVVRPCRSGVLVLSFALLSGHRRETSRSGDHPKVLQA